MKTIAFTGHRPKDLCGYATQPYMEFVRGLADYLASICPADEPLRVITGGAQGVDQLAFWAADLAKNKKRNITNVVYVPFPGQSSVWKETGSFSQKEYADMIAAADDVRYLSEKPGTKSGIVQALHHRNHMMVDAADELLAVYKGSDYENESGGTAECMRYAASKGKPIRILRCAPKDGKLAVTFP